MERIGAKVAIQNREGKVYMDNTIAKFEKSLRQLVRASVGSNLLFEHAQEQTEQWHKKLKLKIYEYALRHDKSINQVMADLAQDIDEEKFATVEELEAFLSQDDQTF